MKDGGFKSIYIKQQQKRDDKERLRQKHFDEAKLTKWQVKVFPYTFWVAVIGAAVALASFFISICSR